MRLTCAWTFTRYLVAPPTCRLISKPRRSYERFHSFFDFCDPEHGTSLPRIDNRITSVFTQLPRLYQIIYELWRSHKLANLSEHCSFTLNPTFTYAYGQATFINDTLSVLRPQAKSWPPDNKEQSFHTLPIENTISANTEQPSYETASSYRVLLWNGHI